MNSSIEKRPNVNEDEGASRVTLVNVMAEGQCMGKPDSIENCFQLAHHFTSLILGQYDHIDGIRIIFDRWDVQASLKQATRNRIPQWPIASLTQPAQPLARISLKSAITFPHKVGADILFRNENARAVIGSAVTCCRGMEYPMEGNPH